jgi:RNA polymerase sigma-70 factor (TIGR02943 family)
METINITQWVNDYTEELYSWAYFKTSSALTAEDLVQDTFLAAAEKLSSFNGNSSPKTWLFSILNHKIIDFYRKKSVNPVVLENDNISQFFNNDDGWRSEKTPTDWQDEEINLLDNEEFNAVLKKCLDALPEKWSMSVKLKYLTEKSGEDICQELGISTTNFWQIVHRAKLQLRNCIENNWFKN